MMEDKETRVEYPKVYIGDGAYAEYDGYQIRVTAKDGISVTNEVFLNPETFIGLLNYAKRFWRWS